MVNAEFHKASTGLVEFASLRQRKIRRNQAGYAIIDLFQCALGVRFNGRNFERGDASRRGTVRPNNSAGAQLLPGSI